MRNFIRKIQSYHVRRVINGIVLSIKYIKIRTIKQKEKEKKYNRKETSRSVYRY